jgi:hypothetical protein
LELSKTERRRCLWRNNSETIQRNEFVPWIGRTELNLNKGCEHPLAALFSLLKPAHRISTSGSQRGI